MNRFLQKGQLQTIEPQKDPSVVEDMDTLVSEVSSDEFLDMVQQEGTPKDLNRAMDMVELEDSAENSGPVDPYASMTIRDYRQSDVLPEGSNEDYDSPDANETEQDRFFRDNYNDIMEDELEYDERESEDSDHYIHDSGDSFDFDFDVDFDLFDDFDDD